MKIKFILLSFIFIKYDIINTMKVLRIIIIIINSLTLFISFILSFLIGILAYIFLSSHVTSDKTAGIILIIFIPLILAFSSINLLFFILKKKGILFWIGIIAGTILIAIYSFSAFLLPEMIKAAALP